MARGVKRAGLARMAVLASMVLSASLGSVDLLVGVARRVRRARMAKTVLMGSLACLGRMAGLAHRENLVALVLRAVLCADPAVTLARSDLRVVQEFPAKTEDRGRMGSLARVVSRATRAKMVQMARTESRDELAALALMASLVPLARMAAMAKTEDR